MSKIEPYSETWRAVKDHAEKRIESLRARLEATGLPMEDTENIRGGLAELRALLKLAERSPLMELPDD